MRVDSATLMKPTQGLQQSPEDMVVVVGGIVPHDDRRVLADLGIRGVGGPDITSGELIPYTCQCTTDRDNP